MVRDGRRAVALISIDGLPAGALDDPAVRLPHLRELATRGTQATGLRPVFPSVTWPCHTTFVTGVIIRVGQISPRSSRTLSTWRLSRARISRNVRSGVSSREMERCMSISAFL